MRGLAIGAALSILCLGCTRGAFYPATTAAPRSPVEPQSILVIPDACPTATIIGTAYVEADGSVALLDALRAQAARAGGSAICAIQIGESSFWVAELFGLFASGGRGPRHARATVISSPAPEGTTLGEY
jgi:hypothetical protein